jgi:hypothetical protein
MLNLNIDQVTRNPEYDHIWRVRIAQLIDGTSGEAVAKHFAHLLGVVAANEYHEEKNGYFEKDHVLAGAKGIQYLGHWSMADFAKAFIAMRKESSDFADMEIERVLHLPRGKVECGSASPYDKTNLLCAVTVGNAPHAHVIYFGNLYYR